MSVRTVPEHVDPVLGRVRYCSRCRTYWPRDAEFWYFDADGRIMSHCRACWSERRLEYAARRAS